MKSQDREKRKTQTSDISLYRLLPDMNTLLEDPVLVRAVAEYGRHIVKEAAREALDEIRKLIVQGEDMDLVRLAVKHLPETAADKAQKNASLHMKRVINATGTILHTNLGRAPVSAEHLRKIEGILSGYSNLEMNLETGKRGRRYDHFEHLLCELTGAEAAMAVNNNAASVLLVLSALCKGGETIVSRGELIEIGGKFRIPDVCEQSGTTLREVGTTNKTHPEDYQKALNENTKAILKVHTSNYRIVGFTEGVGIEVLARICHENDAMELRIPLICDLGSGAFLNLEQFGLSHEPTVKEVVSAGADLVCFSGDKLLGGPQAGLIVGKKQYIDILRAHPLNRALRIGKYTAAQLELTLMEYHRGIAVEHIPVLKMLNLKEDELRSRAEKLAGEIIRLFPSAEDQGVQVAAEPCLSAVGGGSLPTQELPGWAVTIRAEEGKYYSLEELAGRLRKGEVPVIGRIKDGGYWLDMRTIDPKDISLLAQSVVSALKTWHS